MVKRFNSTVEKETKAWLGELKSYTALLVCEFGDPNIVNVCYLVNEMTA